MKKLCALLSAIMICMLSTTAFAATTDATIVLSGVDTVAIGENITITVGVTGDSNDTPLYGTPKISVQWDSEYFEYVSGEVDSTTFALSNPTNYSESFLSSNYVVFSQKILNTEDRPYGAQTFGTLTLKAIKAAPSAEAKISLYTAKTTDTSVYVNAGTSVSGRAALPTDTVKSITITGGAPVANEIDKLDTSIEGMDEIVSAFAGKYYVVGSAVALDAATAVENLYLYAQINNAGDKHYAEKSIGSLLKASGAGVVGSVVPVLVVADADAAALNYTFNADAKN